MTPNNNALFINSFALAEVGVISSPKESPNCRAFYSPENILYFRNRIAQNSNQFYSQEFLSK